MIAAANFSKGLIFDQSTLESFSLSEEATQTFTAFEGYAFNQNALNDFAISETALSHYELGETEVITNGPPIRFICSKQAKKHIQKIIYV